MLQFDKSSGPTTTLAALAPPIRTRQATEISPPALSAAALDVAFQPTASAYSPIVLAGTVRLIEFALTLLVGFAVYVAYVVPVEGFEWYYVASILAITAMATFALQAADVYRVQAFRGHEKQYVRLASAWSVVFFIAISISLYAGAGDEFFPVWLGSFYAIGQAILVGFRRGLFVLVRRWTKQGRLDRRTVVVGADERGETLINAIIAQRDTDIHIVGLFDDRDDDRSSKTIARHQKLGTVDNLVEFARRTRIDLVIFSLPISAEGRILEMLKKLWVLPVDIRLAAYSNTVQFRSRAHSYIGNVRVFNVLDKPITDWDAVTKWLFDRVIGSLLLIAASPIMLLAAIAIKFDSHGPVFFKQKRYGFNNELIEVYKFRSLYVDKCDATGSTQVKIGDDRVTRVGSILRKTSIDELPQLINVVLKGNLSLVGPRPHAIHSHAENRLFDEAVDGYFARHRVKPGITGWAQVNGWRGETDTQEKISAPRRARSLLY